MLQRCYYVKCTWMTGKPKDYDIQHLPEQPVQVFLHSIIMNEGLLLQAPLFAQIPHWIASLEYISLQSTRYSNSVSTTNNFDCSFFVCSPSFLKL